MAFEIGQRVTSSFTGPGTVAADMYKDADGEAFQTVDFDSPYLGKKNWSVKKLSPLDEENEKRKIVVTKSPAVIDYEAAIEDGLTHFQTVKLEGDEPKTSGIAYDLLAFELSVRGCRITVYATPKNVAKVAKELADLLKIDLDKAMDLISLRDRKTPGGSKWNVDFANFLGLSTDFRDALGVNFGHQYRPGQPPNIRRIRCGSTKLVQALIRDGFPVTRVYEEEGETRNAAARGGYGSQT